MSVHVPALPFGIDPLIAEAKQRARRRRLLAAGLLLAVGAGATAGVLAFGAGRGSGALPWLPTKPQLGPANPPLAPACTASQLRGKLGLEGLGFGTLGGPLMIENRGSAPCALVGMPKLSFADATSRWRLRRQGQPTSVHDPLTPAPGSLRALAPGRWAATYLRWSNWCGRGSSSLRSDPGQPPRALVLSAPGGGRISVGSNLAHHQATAPICVSTAAASTLAAARFTPIVPQGPPSSALPLAARIVPTGHVPYANDTSRSFPVVTVRPGTWLSYTVVLTNRSAKPFSFGRRCPAYEEGVSGGRIAAYVLNCHAVATIAPYAAVRFAMRIPIREHLQTNGGYTLTWNLAPYSWNGGVLAQRGLQLR
jgi:Protein of unknown function (DUF4232)